MRLSIAALVCYSTLGLANDPTTHPSQGQVQGQIFPDVEYRQSTKEELDRKWDFNVSFTFILTSVIAFFLQILVLVAEGL